MLKGTNCLLFFAIFYTIVPIEEGGIKNSQSAIDFYTFYDTCMVISLVYYTFYDTCMVISLVYYTFCHIVI